MTGQLSLSQDGNFTYIGTEAQVTSFTLPLNIHGLTIDNPEGVAQSRSITINGFLSLANGVFDNTIGLTFGEEAEIIEGEGSLLIEVSNENIAEIDSELPDKFALMQNYPNPFNPVTTISYDLPEATEVTINLYDITGRHVATLVDQKQAPGNYQVEWNAEGFATGVYLYQIRAGNFTSTKKLTLIK